MVDTLSPSDRSKRMSRVRAKGNRSTEGHVEEVLRQACIAGWIKHPPNVPGRPDFFFPSIRLAIFIDGCFWHACPRCARRTPATRTAFWRKKIDGNRRRDNRTHRRLRRLGYHVVRVWEHELRLGRWIGRIRRIISPHAGAEATPHPMRSDRLSSSAMRLSFTSTRNPTASAAPTKMP